MLEIHRGRHLLMMDRQNGDARFQPTRRSQQMSARIVPPGWVATPTERIYRLERVVPPDGVSGAVRLARESDRDLLVAWLEAFLEVPCALM